MKRELANPHPIAETDGVRCGVEQFERDLPPESGVDEAGRIREEDAPEAAEEVLHLTAPRLDFEVVRRLDAPRVLDGLDAAADNIESDDTDGDVAEAWAEAALQRRVASLLLTDLRAELSDLENWPADVGGGSGEGADASDVAERLEKFGERESALAARLDALGRDEWQERFADRLDAFEDDLDAFDPPVPWGAVLETFSEHQAALGE